jgi:hypothetical protein
LVVLFLFLGCLILTTRFSIYPSKRDKASDDPRETGPPSKLFLIWLLFPIVPYFLAVTYPEAIHYTTFIKPVGQV